MRHHLVEIRKLSPLEAEETVENFSEPEERTVTVSMLTEKRGSLTLASKYLTTFIRKSSEQQLDKEL
jgi:hypothetical protein